VKLVRLQCFAFFTDRCVYLPPNLLGPERDSSLSGTVSDAKQAVISGADSR